jgi:hypothetical protein
MLRVPAETPRWNEATSGTVLKAADSHNLDSTRLSWKPLQVLGLLVRARSRPQNPFFIKSDDELDCWFFS